MGSFKENDLPSVSIVLPIYNGGKTILGTLENIFQQEYPNYEVIAIDDGSQDNSFELMDIFRVKYPQKMKIIKQENLGVSEARNAGVRISKAEYVAFIDADDIWEKNKISRHVELLSSNKDILFSFSNFYRFKYSDGKRYPKTNTDFNKFIFSLPHEIDQVKKSWRIFDTTNSFELLLMGYPIYPSTMVVKRSLLDDVGFWNKAFPKCQDFEFSLKCSKYSKFCYIDEVLVGVGRHDTNLSSDPIKMAEEDVDVLKYHAERNYFDVAQRNKIKYYIGKRLSRLGYDYRKKKNRYLSRVKYHDAMHFKGSRMHAFIRMLTTYLPMF